MGERTPPSYQTAIFPLPSGASLSTCLSGQPTQEDVDTLRRYVEVWLIVTEKRVATLLAAGERDEL